MPELPEVETIRRGLTQLVLDQEIAAVEDVWPKSFLPPLATVRDRVVGRKITGLRRFGKVLVVDLEGDYSLLFHLKMTGQLVFVRAGGERFAGGHPTESMERELPDRSTRAVFTFAGGDKLFFNDQRKFGWIKVEPADNVAKDPLVARMGPEPLSSEFTVERLTLNVKRHPKAPIKAVILDQSTVAGVGNIYADESLHLARIHPARLAGSLTPTEIKRLYEAIKAIIAAGIEHGGTSFTHYVNALGKQGDYLQQARVFRRTGQPCPVCGTIIEKIRVAGRGTHYCPKCQKVKP